MSIRRLAVLSAVKSLQTNESTVSEDNDPCRIAGRFNMSANYNGNVGIFGANLHNNVLIQGAVLMGAVLTAVLICYCCLKTSSKNHHHHHHHHHQQELRRSSGYTITVEPDVQSLQVFTTNSYTDREFDEQRYEDNWLDRSNEEVTLAVTPLRTTCPSVTSGPPPPPYESLIFSPPHQSLPSPSQKEDTTISDNTTICSSEKHEKKDEEIDDGLPPYEAAIKLAADGYV